MHKCKKCNRTDKEVGKKSWQNPKLCGACYQREYRKTKKNRDYTKAYLKKQVTKTKKCQLCLEVKTDIFKRVGKVCSDCDSFIKTAKCTKCGNSNPKLRYNTIMCTSCINKEYRSTDDFKKRSREAKKLRLKNDPVFKIKNNLRKRINSYLKGTKRFSHIKLLGCTPEFLKEYLESKFQPGMTWENTGRANRNKKTWHIDHIKPLSSFDLTKDEEIKRACHYTNLQPLWALDNLKKGASYDILE